MTVTEKLAHAAERKAFETMLDSLIRKSRTQDVGKVADDLVSMVQKIHSSVWEPETFAMLHKIANDPNSKWAHYAERLLRECDPYLLRTFLTAAAYEGGFRGFQQARANSEKYDCNIPWIVLMDPTSACNMRCAGCWAAEYGYKQNLTFEEMDRVLTEGAALGTHACLFTGGEPLMRKADIFRLCEKHRDIAFHAFTNGTLIDEDWARFFRDNRFLVGLSLDGTKDLHDANRVDSQGRGTWNTVARALTLLQKWQVEVNLLCVVTGPAARRGQAIYQNLKKLGGRYLQFIPCLDPMEEERGGRPFSLTPERYGRFLCTIFDLWYQDWERGDYVSVRLFDDYVHLLAGQRAGTCATAGTCGAGGIHNGAGVALIGDHQQQFVTGILQGALLLQCQRLVLGEEHQRPSAADAAQRHRECNAGARHVDAHFAAQVCPDGLPCILCHHRQQHRLLGLFQTQRGQRFPHRCAAAHRAQVHIHAALLVQLQKGIGGAAVGDGHHQKQRTHAEPSLQFNDIIVRQSGKGHTHGRRLQPPGLAGAQLCHKAHQLHRNERGHGHHGHHAESVGDDIAAHGHAGTLCQRQQEGGCHGARCHAARVKCNGGEQLWHHKGDPGTDVRRRGCVCQPWMEQPCGKQHQRQHGRV